MKSQSLETLISAMRKMAGTDENARSLTNFFEAHVRGYLWPTGAPLPRGDAPLFLREEVVGRMIVCFLQDKAGAAEWEDAGLIKLGYARFGKNRHASHVYFVDRVACHSDWLALQMLVELDLVHAAITTLEATEFFEKHVKRPAETVEYGRVWTKGHMEGRFLRRAVLIARLLDQQLKGELLAYLNGLTPEGYQWRVDKGDVEEVTKEIFDMIAAHWPDCESRAELRTRIDLIHTILRPIPEEFEGSMH